MYKALQGLLSLSIILITSLVTIGQVPEDLTSTRSAVIVSVPDVMSQGYMSRGDWKKIAEEAHISFRKIGLDGVVYIYRDDLTAGPEVTKSYKKILDKRQIVNLVWLSVEGKQYDFTYSLDIYPIKNEIVLSNPSYRISAKSLNELMLVLGRQVLRQEIPRTNFLIPDKPEFLDDLVLYTGVRYENIPSRVRSLGIAVIKFDSIPIPDNISEIDKNKLLQQNKEIRAANLELDQIMKAHYPFQYDLVAFESVESLYKKGYQYALMPLTSSGKTIKQMLNYKTTPNENIYVSVLSKKDQKPVLKRIPANSNLTKYYIKQTIVMDIHVGKRWDADVTWQQSLVNFINNLKFDFNID